jgi:hypothetical protein
MTDDQNGQPDDATSLSDEELRELLRRARTTGDEPLRRLVTSYVTLRKLAADAVALVETQFGGMVVAQAPALVRLKQVARRPNA